ncbi:hypothetical protein DPX16_19365, partial [Anabarilius grahami]
PHRRVTFSTANQAQDLQDPSQHSYYDSGLEESETPSSKSSSGPRIGPLALPEDHYERTTPDGSIGEMEHPENEMDGSVGLLWEEWVKTGETMERKRYGGIGDGGLLFPEGLTAASNLKDIVVVVHQLQRIKPARWISKDWSDTHKRAHLPSQW